MTQIRNAIENDGKILRCFDLFHNVFMYNTFTMYYFRTNGVYQFILDCFAQKMNVTASFTFHPRCCFITGSNLAISLMSFKQFPSSGLFNVYVDHPKSHVFFFQLKTEPLPPNNVERHIIFFSQPHLAMLMGLEQVTCIFPVL